MHVRWRHKLNVTDPVIGIKDLQPQSSLKPLKPHAGPQRDILTQCVPYSLRFTNLKIAQFVRHKIVIGGTALPMQHRFIPINQRNILGNNKTFSLLNETSHINLVLVVPSVHSIRRKHGICQNENSH